MVPLALLLAAAACGHDWSTADGVDGDAQPPIEDADGLGDGDAAESDTDGSSEASPDADGAEDLGEDEGADVRDDGTSDVPLPHCGNGVVDPGEECDDGNDDNGDACLDVCRQPWCGDGYVRVGVEECDAGGLGVVPGCDFDCTLAACGDGTAGIVLGVADGFESGMVASPPWENGSPYGFAPSTAYAYDGTWSAGSTNFGVRDSTAWIQVRAATDGEVCFWFMGEPARRGDDEFRFLIDGSEEFVEDRGQLTWMQVCRPVTPGVHTFRWEYERRNRGMPTDALDAYYIDGVETGGPFVEECDDGNLESTDACIETCRAASCGDGYVWADREECDGNGRTCTTSCGSLGIEPCGPSCSWSGTCSLPPEWCNGLDDDCDGLADETYPCRLGETRTCSNACAHAGIETCGPSCTWSGACCASVESCDCGTCDDDCDGTTDEGCVPC